jgi:1,2-phenylacetyl-CoA epoxidase PaaB subunit
MILQLEELWSAIAPHLKHATRSEAREAFERCDMAVSVWATRLAVASHAQPPQRPGESLPTSRP